MGVCLISIYEFFSAMRHDIVKYRSVKIFTITYILAASITLSYGVYCLLIHITADSCWITFTTGILLVMFAVIMSIFGIIGNCLENSIKSRITRNPIIINS